MTGNKACLETYTSCIATADKFVTVSLVFVSVKILKLNGNQKGLKFVYPDYAITSLLCHFIPLTHSIVAILYRLREKLWQIQYKNTFGETVKLSS